jgi:Meiotically up-regulated gene 113
MTRVRISRQQRSILARNLGMQEGYCGGVYVVIPERGDAAKVGHASNFDARLANLQTGCWVKLTMYRRFHTPGELVSRRVERRVHDAIESRRLVGEWFSTKHGGVLPIAKLVALVHREEMQNYRSGLTMGRVRRKKSPKACNHGAEAMGD